MRTIRKLLHGFFKTPSENSSCILYPKDSFGKVAAVFDLHLPEQGQEHRASQKGPMGWSSSEEAFEGGGAKALAPSFFKQLTLLDLEASSSNKRYLSV